MKSLDQPWSSFLSCFAIWTRDKIMSGLDEFYFRRLKIKGIPAFFSISLTLIFHHLKWNHPYSGSSESIKMKSCAKARIVTISFCLLCSKSIHWSYDFKNIGISKPPTVVRQRLTHFPSFEHTQNVPILGEGLYMARMIWDIHRLSSEKHQNFHFSA